MPVESITNLNDPRVDVYRNVRDADLRGRDDLFMAESELVLRRLLKSPQRIHSMLLSPQKYERMRAAIDAVAHPIPVLVADLKLIHEIAAFHIHRGVLAAGYRLPPSALTLDAALGQFKPDSPDGQSPVHFLVAEGMTNVDNMGALFRNAAAFGVKGIVLDPTCCDPLYRKAIRVSMGHTLAIPYAISHDWPGDLHWLKNEWGMTLIAAEINERSIPLWQMPKASRTAIVFGSEGHGIEQQTLAQCDVVCEIPMSSDVPSLNVAVASAVMLYELNRKR